MKLLVANLGSTSFKYRLYQGGLTGAPLNAVARGAFERVSDYAAAIEAGLDELRQGGWLDKGESPDVVAYKTVLGHQLSGCVEADDRVIASLEKAADLAPAHNPPYAEGIRQCRRLMPKALHVALFETAFYQWTSEAYRRYAVPQAWYEAGLQRYGFHGASHKFIAERSATLLGRNDVAERVRQLYTTGPGAFDGPALRVISCHLGGSSSVTGILNGVAIGTSMGLSPQSGLPQNNRVGELDSMAIPFAMRRLGLSLEQVEQALSKESGLLGLSGVSNDMRDITAAAKDGNERARIAREHFILQLRHWIGAFWLELGGLDALVFTAGIGENNAALREAACEGLSGLGLVLDESLNSKGATETDLSTADSRTKVYIIPANEEAVLAEEARRFAAKRHDSTHSI